MYVRILDVLKYISETTEISISCAPQLTKEAPIDAIHNTENVSPPPAFDTASVPSRCEFVKSESISEIQYEEENAFYVEKDDLVVNIEPIKVTYNVEEETQPAHVTEFYPQDEEKLTELIDLLIEQENAKLIASGALSYESDDESMFNDEDESPSPIVTHSSNIHQNDVLDGESEGCGSISNSSKFEQIPKQNTYDCIEENSILTDSHHNHMTIEKEDEAIGLVQYEHFQIEQNERSPQRKVAFRLNSTEDELVYPGQTDSEECTTSSSSSDNSEELVENGTEETDENKVDPKLENDVVTIESNKSIVSENTTNNLYNNNVTEVEHKFERMASEDFDEDCGIKAEGEFQRIVSQLSHEEVDDCLSAWNETEVVINNDEKSSLLKFEGTNST